MADRDDITTIAFEPVERNLRYLRKNVARNVTPGLTFELAAVGDHDGTIVLYIPQTTRLPATASALENTGAEIVPTEVPIISIGAYARTHGLEPIDLIKIDVEGAQSAPWSAPHATRPERGHGVIRADQRARSFEAPCTDAWVK